MNTSIVKKEKRLCICLVSDFFYPRTGGVEVHIYYLSVCLIRRNCKIIIITHHADNRQGVKYMGNGVKVYYLPTLIMHEGTTFPTKFLNLVKFREILIKEEVDIVHCHQPTSVMGLECMTHARLLGKHVVFTDHSLFGLDDLASLNLNKVLKAYLTDVDQTISVSYVGRDNIILRSMVNPAIANVIPNAVDFTKFLPEKEKAIQSDEDTINIVIVSRQTYRKGTDFLIDVIPEVCKLNPKVKFLIGGDGPKLIQLKEMIKSANLDERVILYGFLPHNKVRDLMVQGHIFLNTSLTEAFCIAILEAASTGLYVVSTDVGGVGEVLPDDMITLVKPEKDSIVKGLKLAIDNYSKVKENTGKFHDRLKSSYNWDKMQVYNKAISNTDRSIINRMKRSLSLGNVSGLFLLGFILIDYLLLLFIVILYPKKSYKRENNFEYDKYVELINSMKKKEERKIEIIK